MKKMVETKNPEYWSELSKKGEVENKLSSQILILMGKYVKQEPSTIVKKINNSLSFSDEFLLKTVEK